MNWLRPLTIEWQIFYTRWALSEIPPLHEDVPMLVTRLRNLRAERECAPPSVLRRTYNWL